MALSRSVRDAVFCLAFLPIDAIAAIISPAGDQAPTPWEGSRGDRVTNLAAPLPG